MVNPRQRNFQKIDRYTYSFIYIPECLAADEQLNKQAQLNSFLNPNALHCFPSTLLSLHASLQSVVR